MWIQMQATYSGVAGLFLKGLKYDLPKSKVKLLAVKGKPIYRKCKPPWQDASIIPNLPKPAGSPDAAGTGSRVSD